jgi:hypothetical protein
MTGIVTVALTLMIGGGALPSGTETLSREACRPAFAWVSKGVIRANPTHDLQLKTDAAIIGCEGDLAQLTDQDRILIQDVIRQILIKEHYNLIKKGGDRSFRKDVAAEINARIRKEVVSDVLLINFGTAEAVP